MVRSEIADWSTAYHEAGHAVVGYIHRKITGDVTGCTIDQSTLDGIGLCFGHVTFAATPPVSLRERPESLTNEQWQGVTQLDDLWVQICLAGFTAQARFTGLQSTGETVQGDQSAQNSSTAGPGEATRVDITEGIPVSEEMPSDIRHARRILGFSTAEQDIDDRMRKVNVETAVLLLNVWPAVEAVAEALIEKRTLSGQEIGNILRIAFAHMAAEKRFAAASASW